MIDALNNLGCLKLLFAIRTSIADLQAYIERLDRGINSDASLPDTVAYWKREKAEAFAAINQLKRIQAAVHKAAFDNYGKPPDSQTETT